MHSAAIVAFLAVALLAEGSPIAVGPLVSTEALLHGRAGLPLCTYHIMVWFVAGLSIGALVTRILADEREPCICDEKPQWDAPPPSGAAAAATGVCADILYMVLREALAPQPVDIAQWKGALALAAVCHCWRQVALPLVYRSIFISFSAPERMPRGGLRALLPGKPPSRAECSTNAGLAMLAGQAHTARTVRIAVHRPVPSMAFFQGVADALKLRTSRWPGARLVALEFGPGVLERMGKEFADSSVFVRLFAKSLCGLTSMDIAALGPGRGQQCDFLSALVDAYSGRLLRLSADVDLSLRAARFSSQMTSLRVSMGPLCIQALPAVDPGPLQHLSLFDVVADFEWSIFGGRKEGGPLVFSQLRELSIGYSAGAPVSAPDLRRNQDAVQLRFPALRRLHIFRCPRSCALLDRSIYPQRLDSVVVECASDAVVLERLRGIVPSRALTVLLAKTDHVDPDRYYRATSGIFGAHAVSDRPSLVLRAKGSVPDPARIDWPCLAALDIRTYITTTVLLALLAKLPGLGSLAATYLISSHFPTDVHIPSTRTSGNLSCAHVVHSKVSCMRLRFVMDSKLADTDVRFVLYLVAGTASLRTLSTTPATCEKLAKLMGSWGGQYPHMQRVGLIAALG
ncbi:hypothetical protein H4R18_000932 [Coemansia javaensis]|uniref:F-box domain-containing protein n=1 Tax=Coemansia javaensis TaxID=2761396 RepID=A0A9W8HM21_9FUNG|nr:hypothetical protein H4R18_000932 [Coemansia javaensis]